MRTAPHYIAIEGPLRVGKTALARALARQIRGRPILDPDGNPHLESFYRGSPGAAFRAQMHFLIGRYSQLAAASIRKSHLPAVADFLFEKDKLHAYLNLDDHEVAVYDSYYPLFKGQLPDPDLVVYLKASPEYLAERLAAGRPGVESGVSGRYLEGTVRAYDHFFDRYKAADVLVVDTAKTDIASRPEDLEELLAELARPVRGTQYFLPLEP